GDRRHGRGRVALLLEQPLGGVQDLPPRGGRLLAAARRFVAALDAFGHLTTISQNSLLLASIQLHQRRFEMEAKTLTQREERGRGLHAMWSSVAAGWAEHADYADARGAETTARMLELAALRPGERVLELACGPGGLGLAAAVQVALAGEVVLSDVAPEM